MNQTEELEPEMSINGLYGLDNLGNTCYLNSIIQALSNLEYFRKFLLNKDFIDYLMVKIDRSNETDLEDKLHILYSSPLYQFFRLIKTIWEGSIDSESLKPTTLRKKLGNKCGMFKTSQQQDAHEAFINIIEMMHLEIAQKVSIQSDEQTQLNTELANACDQFWYKEYSPLYSIFHSMYVTEKTCLECGSIDKKYEPNLFLSLDIPKPGVQSLVHTNTSQTIPFVLSNYIHIATKIPSIQIPQEIKEEMCKLLDTNTINQLKEKHNLITCHNSKYDLVDCIYNFIGTSKIDDYKCPGCNNNCSCSSKTKIIIPPQTLCIQIKRFSNNLTKQNNLVTFPIDLDIKELMQAAINSTQYKLKAVINHAGASQGFGHYFTYAYSSINDKWFNFNDDNVTEIQPTSLCTANAYLLFYELI